MQDMEGMILAHDTMGCGKRTLRSISRAGSTLS